MFIGLAAQGESAAVQQRARCTISPGDDSEVGGTRESERERGQRYSFEMEKTRGEGEGGARGGDNDAEREREREKGKQQQSDISTLACCLSFSGRQTDRQTQQLFQEFTS